MIVEVFGGKVLQQRSDDSCPEFEDLQAKWVAVYS